MTFPVIFSEILLLVHVSLMFKKDHYNWFFFFVQIARSAKSRIKTLEEPEATAHVTSGPSTSYQAVSNLLLR